MTKAIGFAVANHQLRLMMTAPYFDHNTRSGRKLSHRKLRQLYVDLQRCVDPVVCLEIGASEARFARMVRSTIRREAQVIAFEANPYAFEKMTSTYDYAGRHRVDYKHLAISDHDGTVEFQIKRSRGGQDLAPELGDNSLLTRQGDDIEYETVSVPSLTLDTFFAQSSFPEGPISVWIDVEGAAKLVLAGAAGTMERIVAIMIEVEDDRRWEGQWVSAEVFEHLIERGFIPVARDFEYRQQYNVVFVKEVVTRHPLFGCTMTDYLHQLGGLNTEEAPISSRSRAESKAAQVGDAASVQRTDRPAAR